MPYLKKQGCYINLRGVISVISQLTWYIYIGARLLELEVSINYIRRYTKRPVIAETRIISCTEKSVIFMFKDYNQEGLPFAAWPEIFRLKRWQQILLM